MTLLIGRQAILSKLPGIQTWKTAKRFLMRHNIFFKYDPISGKPILSEEEINSFWEKEKKNKME